MIRYRKKSKHESFIAVIFSQRKITKQVHKDKLDTPNEKSTLSLSFQTTQHNKKQLRGSNNFSVMYNLKELGERQL